MPLHFRGDQSNSLPVMFPLQHLDVKEDLKEEIFQVFLLLELHMVELVICVYMLLYIFDICCQTLAYLRLL